MDVPNLRTQRLRRFMTQSELAAATGMTKASISRLETGGTKARISTVRRLAAALEVSSAELMSVTDMSKNEDKERLDDN